MNQIKKTIAFIINGMKVFSLAARGQYRNNSGVIQELRKQVLKMSSVEDDHVNLRNDIRNISNDIRVSFQNITCSHG